MSVRKRYLPVLIILLALIGIWQIRTVREWVTGTILPLSGAADASGGAPDGEDPAYTKKSRTAPKKTIPYENLQFSSSKDRLLKNRVISDEAAKALELTDSERSQTQLVLDKHFDIMRELIRPTIVTTEKGTSTVFLIPALRDRGKEQLDSLTNDLSSILQYDRTKKVLEKLPLSLFFGGFGQYDSTVEVTPRENFPEGKKPDKDWVKIVYTNPVSGETTAQMSTSTDRGFEYYPGIFEESQR